MSAVITSTNRTTTKSGNVFNYGSYKVDKITVQTRDASKPPKPLFIVYPLVEWKAEFGVVLLLHGYMLSNTFYSQLMEHLASYGFIIIAPRLYEVALGDSTKDIRTAASITTWIAEGGLVEVILQSIVADTANRFALAGHSRGGKDAFGLALGVVTSSSSALPLSALIGIDPVAGTIFGQTNPKILSNDPGSSFTALNNLPVMVIGSGLDDEKGGLIRCTPKGVSHGEFYRECERPTCYFVVKGYGHLDVLDDETPGIEGLMSHCMCRNGSSREPMRRFTGGVSVAFLMAYLDKDDTYLKGIEKHNVPFPVEFDKVDFRL